MLSDIPDARIMVKEVCNIGGKAGESDISVEISGDQISQILSLADSVKSLIESVSGLVDPRISWKEARPEITIIPNRQLLDEYGMNVLNMGQDIETALPVMKILCLGKMMSILSECNMLPRIVTP